jgi:hypothetical protein
MGWDLWHGGSMGLGSYLVLFLLVLAIFAFINYLQR